MECSIWIADIILSMRKYQEDNNIKKQCLTNVQYLYDVIRMNSSSNVKTKAVYLFSTNDEEQTNIFIGGHVVITLDDETILEPSQEIYCLKNVIYFDNIKDLMDNFVNKDELKSVIDIKKIVSDHITFVKLSEQINNNELIISDREHYDKQADYIENYMRRKPSP
jgi:hypothetical protein